MSKQTRRLSQIASQIRYDVIERVYDESEKALESGESTTRYTVEYILAEVIKLLSQDMAGFIWDESSFFSKKVLTNRPRYAIIYV